MKSTIVRLGILLAAFALLFSCATPEPEEEREPQLQSPWQVIDHQNLQLGGEIPGWVTQDVGALEASSTFEGNYVFKVENFGGDLNGVKTQTNVNYVNTEVARIVQTRVEQKYVEAQVGDQDFVEAYFENLVQVLTSVDISGLRRYGEYWLLRVHRETEEEQYAYYVLYTINKDVLDDQVTAAIEGAEAETEEEQTARDRVREIFANGL